MGDEARWEVARRTIAHLLDEVSRSRRPADPLRLRHSLRSDIPTDPVRGSARSYGLEPDLEVEIEAPEGGGPILELAVLRAG